MTNMNQTEETPIEVGKSLLMKKHSYQKGDPIPTMNHCHICYRPGPTRYHSGTAVCDHCFEWFEQIDRATRGEA